jgi:hypothetical protein
VAIRADTLYPGRGLENRDARTYGRGATRAGLASPSAIIPRASRSMSSEQRLRRDGLSHKFGAALIANEEKKIRPRHPFS